jgi:hypothetical protein
MLLCYSIHWIVIEALLFPSFSAKLQSGSRPVKHRRNYMKFSIGCCLFASLFSASAFAGSFVINFTADSGIAPSDTEITWTGGLAQFDFLWDGLTFTTSIDAFFNKDSTPGMGLYEIYSTANPSTGLIDVSMGFHNYPENQASGAGESFSPASHPEIPVGTGVVFGIIGEGTFVTEAVPEPGSVSELTIFLAAGGLVVAPLYRRRRFA